MENAWLALAAGIVIAIVAWYAARRARRHEASIRLNEEVQTWEDEGGNVPDVPTVSPKTDPSGRRP